MADVKLHSQFSHRLFTTSRSGMEITMRERFVRFMQGRHGADQLSNFLVIAALVVVVLELFVPVPRVRQAMNSLGIAMIIVAYYRIFSRNHARRYEENERFLKYYNRVLYWWRGRRAGSARDKTHRIFKCPSCKQSVRVPKGKGKIAITCPKCHTEFIKKT